MSPDSGITDFIKNHFASPNYSRQVWTSEHEQVISDFLNDSQQSRLFVLAQGEELTLTNSLRGLSTTQQASLKSRYCAYIVKQYTPEKALPSLHYGVVKGQSMQNLLQLMQGMYEPQLQSNRDWPAPTKKELIGHYHRFMANLSELANHAAGRTVLYAPAATFVQNISAAAKDREFVQQLESVLIQWMRQVKDTINHHMIADAADDCGPLEEIKFWQDRNVDLMSISEQLDRQDVKRVMEVLQVAKSSYLENFLGLIERIREGSEEASNNLQFLQSVQEPCEALANAMPEQIPAILPRLLIAVRFIWSVSRYYHTEDRLTGLLRKVSNETIRRCRKRIDLTQVLGGTAIADSLMSLQESIACGLRWKQVYRKTVTAISTGRSNRSWGCNETSIFAQVDAFVQRCRDLLDVCEGHMQFARRPATNDSKPQPLPELGGATRAQEVLKGMLGIQASFESHLQRLRQLDYDLLDVRVGRWHEDHTLFKSQLKDMDVMYNHVMTIAFDGLSRVADGVALLEVFHHLAKRDAIKRAVEKKTIEVIDLFRRLVDGTRREFDEGRRAPPLRENEPDFAGSALWARGLSGNVQESWEPLRDSRFLSGNREAQEAKAAQCALQTVLQEYRSSRYQAWVEGIERIEPATFSRRLEVPLIRRLKGAEEEIPGALEEKTGYLASNFDRDLAALFVEVAHWEKFHGELTIPYAAHDICSQREKLRIVQEHVMLIVRAYNGILDHLSPDERHLFSDHVRRLDKRVNQGLTKLTWSAKGMLDMYVKDCLAHCIEVRGLVTQLQSGKAALARSCRNIGATLLVKLDKNVVYEGRMFEVKQAAHRQECGRRLQAAHQGLWTVLRDLMQLFKDGSNEVQRELRALVASTDRALEVALRQCVKRSLQELSRAINGDQKLDAQSLFKVNLVLDGGKVEYRPNMIHLTKVLNETSKQIMTSVSPLPRLRETIQQESATLLATAGGETVPAAGQMMADAAAVATSAYNEASARRTSGTAADTQSMQDVRTPDTQPGGQGLRVVDGIPKEASVDAKAESPNNPADAKATKNAGPKARGATAKTAKGGTQTDVKAVAARDTKATGMDAKNIMCDEQALSGANTQTPVTQPVNAVGPSPGPSSASSFYLPISADHDILSLVAQVKDGMSSATNEMSKYQSFWDKYRPLWEVDQEAFIRRFASAKRSLQSFEADISRYQEQQDEIEKEDATYSVMFIRIDCTLIKKSLVDLAVQWQGKLTGLLNHNALQELRNLLATFQANTSKLTTPPGSLDQLSENIGCLKDVVRDLPTMELRFAPLEDIYAALKKYQVQIPEAELQMLAGLRGRFEDFKVSLIQSEKMLDRSKQSMKRDLEMNLEAYKIQTVALHTEAASALPYSANMSLTRAFAIIAEYRERVDALRKVQATLQPGLELFSMDRMEDSHVLELERDLELMMQVWRLTADWSRTWDHWKSCHFQALNLEDIQKGALNMERRLTQLGRQISGWSVWEAMRDRIEQFKATLPLIQDLKNHALRDRHWQALSRELGKEVNPSDPSFSLEQVFVLSLHAHADFVGELSGNASKELAIESALAEMKAHWQDVMFDTVLYKDKYYKLRGTDELLQRLEEDIVALSSMKASKFYASFADAITGWKQELTKISETVELVLTVQRKWVYLENIFLADGDISRQLTAESALFKDVDAEFIWVGNLLHSERNAQRTCRIEILLPTLTAMDEKLEVIQKSLDQYLEGKRRIFPRFFFVSDGDLLEILGQSREPLLVQKHIKKCFEGIKRLNLVPTPRTDGSQVYEARAMLAPDGESADFVEPVVCEGAVELWLSQVEKAMSVSLQKLLAAALLSLRGKKDQWSRDTQGQLLITTSAIFWTSDCHRALSTVQGGDKTGMRALRKKQVGYLSRLTDVVRSNLSAIERSKLAALITLEIHNRDVMDRIIKTSCASVDDFEWLSQLRFVFVKEQGRFGLCWAKQTISTLQYAYEYQGNNGRLVVTPLTDRCVLTLTTAMFLNRGGNPLGPAGTGKTETVKDLGKNLARYVLVVNCSEGQDYKSVGRILSGLVQSGTWGCFDEFNRIKIEVISVVTMQIMAINNAMAAKLSDFSLMGQMTRCHPSCGIFITMNPTYAGRTELPDNLKALMRPVAMMVADMAMIAEVVLASEGFHEGKMLAKKTVTLYHLMTQQLSKQDHYDCGLRSLKAVLRMAGSLKRQDPQSNEEAILMRALRDMNLPKFVQADACIFHALLTDMFPSLDLLEETEAELSEAIKRVLAFDNLQAHPFLLQKTLQLHETKATRHCVMLIGPTLSGKSTAWKTLANAKSELSKEARLGYNIVQTYPLNPASVSLSQLYGSYDFTTGECTDGILASIFKACAENSRPDEKWIVLDSPVDAHWVESMNSVMDDNRVLTPINGDRIPLTESMSLLFEVDDLSVASPATISRAGMVYMQATAIGWEPYLQSWLQQRFPNHPDASRQMLDLFDRFTTKVLEYKRQACTEPVPMSDFQAVQSLLKLYEALSGAEEPPPPAGDVGQAQVQAGRREKRFLFSLIWSIMAAVDDVGRTQLDNFLRDIEPVFPPTNTVYDYALDDKKGEWELWESRVPPWRLLPNMPFHKMVIPTVDSVRNARLLSLLIQHGRHTLVTGPIGSGKTVLIDTQIARLPSHFNKLCLQFSAGYTSETTQNKIEGAMERRSKDKYGPIGGAAKRLLVFIDDFNMPRRTSAESPCQPPLELLRLWMDYEGWHDRQKCTWRYIQGTQLLCAMGAPGSGGGSVSARTLSRFHQLYLPTPATSQLIKVFDSILSPKFADFDNEIKALTPSLAKASLAILNDVQTRFPPTPSRYLYVFTLRDVARVTGGFLQAARHALDTRDCVLRLWAHECLRTFADRFVEGDHQDQQQFRSILDASLREHFHTDWKTLMTEVEVGDRGPVFCSFLRQTEEAPYEEVPSMARLKALLEEKLSDYNLEPKLVPMQLVLFEDALRHVCRINRVLRHPRGSLLLVGVGGSGKQSLTRLAAYVSGYEVCTIEVTDVSRLSEFREALKKVLARAGIDCHPLVLLLNDRQLKDESFLEDIAHLLCSGQIPNLYTAEEVLMIQTDMHSQTHEAGTEETPEAPWQLFIERIRTNLHIVLAMSPIGPALRRRCRTYPQLLHNTTINCFHPWPTDALQEVASNFLRGTCLSSKQMQESVARAFASVHASVVEFSNTMLLELKRYNYVSPASYLELVTGFNILLEEKRKELGEGISKLTGGLAKLEDSQKQVAIMSVELEKKKGVVAKAQTDCEELLVEIVSERRVADEQRKQIESESSRIAKEETDCQAIALDAQADLDVAMPALESAMAEVDKLDKNAISEIKAYQKPPKVVETVMAAVMVLFGQSSDWTTAKRMLAEANFLQKIKLFDKDNISPNIISKVKKYVGQSDFMPDEVQKVSSAAAALCSWVHAIYIYANVFKELTPKRNRLKEAMDGLASKQAAVKVAQDALGEVTDRIARLKERYDISVAQKNKLREEAEVLEVKLKRADQLVKGLSSEYTRWQHSITELKSASDDLPGNCLLASAFLSYAGPFGTTYRHTLINRWLFEVRQRSLPHSASFNFSLFVAKPIDVREWNIQGLPAGAFATENGVIITRGRRWPLIIDPQGQANKWIRTMEGKQLQVLDSNMSSFLSGLVRAVQFGKPVLLQNVLEELDTALEPVLSRAIIKQGGQDILRLGDKDVPYNHDFKLYITTKLANPHFPPEVSGITAVVNFAVRRPGMEAQLLGVVVQREQPDLEKQKSELVIRVAAGKRKMMDLENTILRLLSESKGSLLDDESLNKTLQASKATSEEVTQQLQVAEETEMRIDAARENYRPAAVRAAIAYFVLDEMLRIDPMYQYSLDAYLDLFCASIDRSRPSSSASKASAAQVGDRCSAIIATHTLAVYKYACRGTFERHKLLFSFQLCIRILQEQKKVTEQEIALLCCGAIVLDRSEQRSNPWPEWLTETAWDTISEMDRLPGCTGLSTSLEQAHREWRKWHLSSQPEVDPLPGDWSNKLTEMQQVALLRAMRPDRVLPAITRFVSSNLGTEYIEPPAFDLAAIYEGSSEKSPLIFVLSPGVDPTKQVVQLADTLAIRLEICALGQGQASAATQLLEEGVKYGFWLFLINCHLMLSWLPTLGKLIEQHLDDRPNPNFRLWLSAAPRPDFPVSILQCSIKMTIEPPCGLRANLLKLYNGLSPEQFSVCRSRRKYKKLVFVLAWFHALLLERRKFKSLGFNSPYDFNDSDFSVSHDLLTVFLDEYPDETPFPALRYLIAEAMYGGRVTDEWDRRLVNVYINQYFCEAAVQEDNFPLSELPDYSIPADTDLNGYREYIKGLPSTEHPAAFGQHANADLSSQIERTNDLLSTILTLQPRTVVREGESLEAKATKLADSLLAQVPAVFDVHALQKANRTEPEALQLVLHQEVHRYNILLCRLRTHLHNMKAAMAGVIMMNPELEDIMTALLDFRVPASWTFCYPSTRPLASWMRDLIRRCQMMMSWVEEGMPKVLWLPGLTFPTGLLTALLQTVARRNSVPIDTLAWEHTVLNQAVERIEAPAEKGAYLSGFVLEGARWDVDNGWLVDALPMELSSVMPVIHFKPVEGKKKAGKGTYACPVYRNPLRGDTRQGPSYVTTVELKSGQATPDVWVKRGVAMLLSSSQ